MKHVKQFSSLAALEHFLNVDGRHMQILAFSSASHGVEVLYTLIILDPML